MKRHAINRLQEWKEDPNRLPLIIRGARQVGKTWLMQEFGRTAFERCAYINFDRNERMQNLFSGDFDVDRILRGLAIESGMEIDPENTLIILDEIQEVPAALQSLKYFCEDNRHNYYILAAGSLLGIAMHEGTSFPVGKVDSMDLYPLSFTEFLSATGNDQLLELLEQRDFGMVTAFRDKYIDLLRTYYYVGGMPAAVDKYIESNNLQEVMAIQQDIIRLYKRDIAQYDPDNKLYIEDIFNLIPPELNAKNKRFIFKRLNENAKFDRYQNSFLWLKNAGVALPVYNVEEPKVPLLLARSRNLFKLFQNDVGLLAAQYAEGIQLQIITGSKAINFGAVYENVVAQELVAHGIEPYYYNSKKRGELDFVIELGGKVLPIEVKSGKDYEVHRALSNMMDCGEYDLPEAVIFTNDNLRVEGKYVYAPIYMVMFLEKRNDAPVFYKVDLSMLH